MVVNDPAERRVKLIQDFISTSTDENLTKKETKTLSLIYLVFNGKIAAFI